jgi:cytoskeletal protein CcmA (bactofilin family)
MFEKGREEMMKGGASETVVGASVKLKGNLRSDGDILIDGVVTGDLKTKGSVVVGETASVVASIKAQNIVISGAVQGNIEVSDRLEITKTGKVIGDLMANVLSIAPGASFSGKCQMPDHARATVAEPVLETEESEEAKEEN